MNEHHHNMLNDSDTRHTGSCGHEAQAIAFAKLTDALDLYIEKIEQAESSRQEIIRSATLVMEGQIEEANRSHDKNLIEIQTKYDKAKSDIEGKHHSKLKEAAAERHKTESRARNEHQGKVAESKQVRNESLWLADTVLESSLYREEVDQKKKQQELTQIVSSIDSLESTLVESLSPSVARSVGEIPQAEQKHVSDLSFDLLRECVQTAMDAVVVIRRGELRSIFLGRKKKIDRGVAARNKIERARNHADSFAMDLMISHESRLQAIRDKHRGEKEKANFSQQVICKDCERKCGAVIKEAVESFEIRSNDLSLRYDRSLVELDQWCATQTGLTEDRFQAAVQSAEEMSVKKSGDAQSKYDRIYRESNAELADDTSTAMKLIDSTSVQTGRTNLDWVDMPSQTQPTDVPLVVRFASAELSLKERLVRVDSAVRDQISIPEVINTPAVYSLPGSMSLLLTHGVDTRDKALSTMRAIMTRILASFPAGKARFVMADPIGIGQSFAGFMRLSDQDPSPVGQRIWAEPQHIERQLADITEHMQTVIQKYLRKDFATVEEYNKAAGEIAEPYRFIIIADLHVALTDSAAGRLKSILESGPRCGVYAILSTQAVHKLPPELRSILETSTLELLIRDEDSTINDQRVKEVRFEFDPEPSDQLASEIFDRVVRAGAIAGRVEVPFERLSPEPEKRWTRTCEEELVIPLGRSGAQKNQELRLGLGTRQHALIAGRTGSGKSTLLHVMITAAAMWYSPDELEMYLIDFKKGVEFKAYTGGRMPHVRAVAIESDREFGLSVLKRLDEELTLRGDLFRKLGTQSLESARSSAPQERLPRVMLLIDEFQEFFTEDDEVASEATLLLDRLVRQGRAFGVHVVLGSQTLAGAYSLARSTLGQIGVRIALQCSETDSYLILGEDNSAARLLERPGEAIYNNAGGLVEGNSPFQTAWLPDATRDECLDALPKTSQQYSETVVFEGNKPANLEQSATAFAKAHPDRSIPRLLLGDAVAIAPPVAPSLNRRSGANLLVVGPQSEPAMGMLLSSAITFASTPKSRIVFVDPTPEDDSAFGHVASALHETGLDVQVVPAERAVQAVAEINQIVTSRGETGGDPVLLVLGGIHRLRALRKRDDFSFSLDEDSVSPDKELAGVLLEGPAVGVWTAAWCDSLTNLERAVDRSSIREFGLRALMQMSASDSAMLMDSSTASALGANRAILVDEVSGATMKFRPVALVDTDAVQRVSMHLNPDLG